MTAPRDTAAMERPAEALRVAVIAAEKFLREVGKFLLENDFDMHPDCPEPDPEMLADDLGDAFAAHGSATGAA